jgi:hypothetical protein
MSPDMEKVNVSRLEKTKESLANFREFLTAIHDLFTWKREWFPALIVGVVTLFYGFVWWYEVTVLTTLSALAILGVCVDVACVRGRKFITQAWPWNPSRERQFTDICIWISHGGANLSAGVSKLAGLRESSPLVYYAGTVTALLFTAWIGNAVPNHLLCYGSTLGLALYPGIDESGVIGRHLGHLYPQIRQLVTKYMPKKQAGAPKED